MAEFLSVAEAASFLGIKKSYLYKLVCERRLPCYKPMGGRLLFDQAELENVIRKGRRSTRDELSERAETLLNSKRR